MFQSTGVSRRLEVIEGGLAFRIKRGGEEASQRFLGFCFDPFFAEISHKFTGNQLPVELGILANDASQIQDVHTGLGLSGLGLFHGITQSVGITVNDQVVTAVSERSVYFDEI